MKEGIHPDYPAAQVSCACGHSFITRSTRGDFQVDVCAKCHPFYTGTQKLMDTAGRVDRFKRRYEAQAKKPAAAAKPAAAKAEVAKATEEGAAPAAAGENEPS
jgi:large subunit ribosomal protein L31